MNHRSTAAFLVVALFFASNVYANDELRAACVASCIAGSFFGLAMPLAVACVAACPAAIRD